MPNIYGYIDVDNDRMNKSTLVGPGYLAGVKDVEAHGAKWTGVNCSFWYEWSLVSTLYLDMYDLNHTYLAIYYTTPLTNLTNE